MKYDRVDGGGYFELAGTVFYLQHGTPDWRVAEICIREQVDPARVFKSLDSQDFFPREDES